MCSEIFMVFPWNKTTLSTIGQYKIVKELGRGSFGAVYMAMDQNLGVPVAIKALLLDNPSSLQEEARVLSELRHPNVAGFRQLFEKGGKWYMVIDFVDGGTLRDLIVSRKLYDGAPEVVTNRILTIAAGAAAGLGFAHSLGVIHQDVKPSNVMIGADATPKVTDFGLARARPKTSPAHGQSSDSAVVSVLGMTPAYCSPEQSLAQPVTAKSDSWSWGLTILEIFAGGVLWRSGVLAKEALAAYLGSGPPDHSLPWMPKELAELLERCFDPVPEKRPALAEVAIDVKAIDPKKYSVNPAELRSRQGRAGYPLERTVRFGDEQMEFVIIPPGEFMKGNPKERRAHQQPTKIDKPLYIARFTVTQRQWRAINGNLTPDLERMEDDAPVKGVKKPMVFVSWHECIEFISKFNKLELGEWLAVLPTGDQWEYACRAGSDTRYCFGDEVGSTNRNYDYDEFHNRLSAYAWYNKDGEYDIFGERRHLLPANRPTGLQPVGLKLPNAWGLFDLHGNVSEWCDDQLVRGGDWGSFADRCCSYSFEKPINGPGWKFNDIGFRIALILKPDPPKAPGFFWPGAVNLPASALSSKESAAPHSAGSPQISCPKCRARMVYTAAKCPQCGNRMVTS
jgi:serine/threonine protein kinase